ncbi:MAG: TonB-dependent receptor [Alphaproteobacteria bacterium]|nr:TonB-dependent receptor [Alphaproteobacteria bacterium]
MSAKSLKAAWLLGVAGAAICLGGSPAFGQQASTAGPQAQTEREDQSADAIVKADTIVVLGEIAYRNRTEETAPVLEYGLDYFQRFEPLTVGDALKRVPSVTFLSDVLESDGVRLRGLDPAYTQILINGEKVPGAGSSSGAFGNGADGAFFVDRIPAELIQRIEIVRSASANRSGDAMAGALNIVLRDGYSLDGGYVRVGALGFDDGRVRETYGAVWGGDFAGGRLLAGANVQGRRNPKRKFSARYDDVLPGGALVTIEDQFDTRDGTDYSGNFSYDVDLDAGDFNLSGFYVRTDREAREASTEYATLPQPSAISASDRNRVSLFTLNVNPVDTQQDSWGLSSRYELESFGGETTFRVGYAKFDQSENESENEAEYLRGGEFVAAPAANRVYPEIDRFTRDLIRFDVDDTEYKAKVDHVRELNFGEIRFGLQYDRKERDLFAGEGRFRVSLPNGTVSPDASGVSVTIVQPTISPNTGGDNSVERTQIAPYAMLSGESGDFSWEAGLRYESTEVDVTDRTVGGGASGSDYSFFLPSAHVKWELTAVDRLSLSAARTIRNPSFDFLSPAVLEEELGENDFQGNPDIEPESAWGLDAGYERRLGSAGIAGVNIFYRQVTDLIEIFNTGVLGSCGDPTCFVYSPRNTGDGKVYGIEFDYSAPLTFIGLPDTGVFANYSLLDSDVDDEFGSRRFNSQSDHVYNIGFIHDLVVLDAAFGVTYRKQGDAFSRVLAEEVTTSYGGVLEAFVEKSIGDNFTIRLTGSNLTDGTKDEIFDKFGSFSDQVSRSYDEYEIETEKAGPTWQIIGRYSF